MRYKKVYDNLYHQIIDYFEKDKPWRNPDFSIHDLATKLNTNNTYISRAINYSSGMNFKTLVNKHRIEYIKNELLTDNVKKRYTLLYIYTSAGFRHQSTFNKAFKQIENMTPSEYILMLGNQELTTPIDLT
ncbi:helix-turn-helix domain-containing protein [Epilithonimonas sp.]|uniref:helix-turn-helix domain-containing protein n=1 Tax=Epilithonimonas sp. TaxID=2894511 RepID=UPI0035B1CA71